MVVDCSFGFLSGAVMECYAFIIIFSACCVFGSLFSYHFSVFWQIALLFDSMSTIFHIIWNHSYFTIYIYALFDEQQQQSDGINLSLIMDPQLLQELNYMPKITKDQIYLQTSTLNYRAKCMHNMSLNKRSQKLYKLSLYANPNNIQTYKEYLCTLKQLNKHKQVQNVYDHIIRIQQSRKNGKKLLILYAQYIEYASKSIQQRSQGGVDQKQYQKIRKCILKLIELQPSNTKMYAKYANYCHKSKKFEEGIRIINKYQEMYKQKMYQIHRMMLWRIYLSYQISNYSDAYHYCHMFLTNSNNSSISKADLQYYRIQQCKYCALLNKYQQSIKMGEMVLANTTGHRTKLKVIAIKGYCYYTLNSFKQMMQAFKLGFTLIQQRKSNQLAGNELKDEERNDYNDQIFMTKWTLIRIGVLCARVSQYISQYINDKVQDQQLTKSENAKQNQHIFQDNKISRQNIEEQIEQIRKAMQKACSNMLSCSRSAFTINHKYSQHYNWYEQLVQFRNHFVYIYQSLPTLQHMLLGYIQHQLQHCETEIGSSDDYRNRLDVQAQIQEVQEQSRRAQFRIVKQGIQSYQKMVIKLFLTFLQGYEQSQKTNRQIANIQSSINTFSQEHQIANIRLDILPTQPN